MLRATILSLAGIATALAAEPVKLFVKEVPLTVHGKTVTMTAIEQADGTPGYSPHKADGFDVEVVNQLKVPTTIHWHGLTLPNAMDGVPYVTQDPIPPGGTFRYTFPLHESGTYWMHSHYALQEQFLTSAPLIIWTPEERAKADRQFVVMLSDFSFTPPAKILEALQRGGESPAAGAPMKSPEAELVAQAWNDHAEGLTRVTRRAARPDIDVQYDALLANRRTIDNPEVLAVQPGESVLLRIIAASSATNFYLDTGSLEAEILAVDGRDVTPVKGNFFQLAVAQRIDLRVTIPETGGAFPILAQGEGTTLLCGVVLATPDVKVPALPRSAELATAALDNTQELQLAAARPLSDKQPDRSLPCILGGSMHPYVWTINEAAYPNRNSLHVKDGHRVEVVFSNITKMGHPMHLHGHDFQVTEIDGVPIAGARRDTIMVPAGAEMKVAFEAKHPGLWAFHCHIIYHLATGMFTVLKYDGVETPFWQPEMTPKEIQSLD